MSSRSFSRRQSGKGQLKAVIWVAIFAFLVYASIMVVPVLYAEYEFQDAMVSAARFGAANRLSVDDIRKNMVTEARADEIPLEPNDIHVESVGGNVHISAPYAVTVNLQLFQWTLKFNPTASTD